MTTTDPRRLDDALADTFRVWPAITGQAPPLAVLCAAEHPFDPATLCRHLRGHTGLHACDPDNTWTPDPTDPKENDRG